MRVLMAIISLIASLLGCGQAPNRRSIEEDRQGHASVSQASGPFHSLTGWTEKVGFYIDDTAPDAVAEGAIQAASTWNDALGREVLNFVGVAKVDRGDELYSSLDDALTMVYYEKHWTTTTGKAQTTLATTIWENASGSDQIVKGDVILNGQLYQFCDATAHLDSTIKSDEVVDAQTVLLHEFGHLLGLDHVEVEADPESVMHAKTFIGPFMSFRELSDGDMAHIRQLYD